MKVLIPARLESTRLPRKLLKDIAGCTVLRRCVNGLIAQGFDAEELCVVTDSEMIKLEVASWSLGVRCALRNYEATCGTQRVHEFLVHEPSDSTRVLIWQADEIIDTRKTAVLRDFFETLPSGISYNFYTRWSSPKFPEGGVQVCGSDVVTAFTRARLKTKRCAGLHVGIYLLDVSVFKNFPPDIWDRYDESIEMNALLALGYPLHLRELHNSDDWDILQVNTLNDLEVACSIFMKEKMSH